MKRGLEMKHVKRRRPSPALVLSMIALFVSLAGTANSQLLSSTKVDSYDVLNNSLKSIDLQNNTVKSIDLKNNTVTSTDLQNNTVTGTDVNNGSLTGTDILDNSVTSSDVGVLDGSNLGGGIITSAKIADGTITADDLATSFPNVSLTDSGVTAVTEADTCFCDPGDVADFDTEVYDVGGLHSTSSNSDRVTVPRTGLYQVAGSGVWANTSAVIYKRQIQLLKNGSYFAGAPYAELRGADGSNPIQQSISGVVALNAGDYLQLGLYQEGDCLCNPGTVNFGQAMLNVSLIPGT
jgi:hypothetical protein